MSISSTVVSGADIRFVKAADALGPFVGCFWVITTRPRAMVRVVPDGSTAISIELRRNRRTAWQLRGPLVRPEERRFPAASCIVGVRLRPGVAHILTGVAADVLVNRRTSLDALASFRALTRAEPRPDTPACCIELLERFLIDQLRTASVNDAVAAALAEIERAQGCIRVSHLARMVGVSPRQLNRLMRSWIGYGAKRAASIARFQAALHRMEQSPGQPAAALALANGYFDQSHLNLDVTRFAGSTPRRLTSDHAADFAKTLCADGVASPAAKHARTVDA
jgi:methylphosphotriester-DNA--protein-cysteine methyltransferase